MAGYSTSEIDGHMSPTDRRNFQRGVVNSDAVYVPQSKQSFRGHRGRGNYRNGNQPNDYLDTSEYGGSRPSGARSKFRGGRGQKLGHRGQYYARYNKHSTASESQHFPDRDEASFDNSNHYSRPNVTDRTASVGASADSYGVVRRAYSDEAAEFQGPSFHATEHDLNSRMPRKVRDEERSQTHGQRLSGGGWPCSRRGRGYRGAFNNVNDDRYATLDISHQNNSASELTGLKASRQTDNHGVTEFHSDGRNKFGLQTSNRSNEKHVPKDDNYTSSRPTAVGHGSDFFPDYQQFRDLRISREVMNNGPSKGSSQAVLNSKLKNTDPEFETQRGYVIYLRDFFKYSKVLFFVCIYSK